MERWGTLVGVANRQMDVVFSQGGVQTVNLVDLENWRTYWWWRPDIERTAQQPRLLHVGVGA
ncbi:hypothetical protein [Candidatus Amarolinea dominans]|uniref:hypothetical protein n=1 Tax=Candidatus Amarolinea dominans TaxID=3140696 RepID=UPI0031364565|nr:hypothetical protein [Anaerolineae bacterium]